MSSAGARVGELDVVGLGALNIDYIAGASRLSALQAEQIAESSTKFECNFERAAGEEKIMRMIDRIGVDSLDPSLGGSAWNTVSAIAGMKAGLRLGFVGMLGQEDTPGLSFARAMADNGIDDRWVGRRDDASGICLSYMGDTERIMRVFPGANAGMARHLRDHHDEIAAYLASSRVVHVTSFFDPDTPDELIRVLRRAKAINPGLKVSFDPGHDWARRPSPAVEDILRHSDLLFVNNREFTSLGNYSPGERDEQIAGKVLDRCGEGCQVFVTKRYDLIEGFRDTPRGMRKDKITLPLTTLTSEIEDATGAGDVFSAAVLAASLSRPLQAELGSAVAMRLLAGRGLKIPSTGRRRGAVPRVCVVHDADPQVAALQAFLEDECGLSVFEVDCSAADARATHAMVREALERCGSAVCLLRGRHDMSDGTSRASQRVIYYMGMFQGRCGIPRVAVLMEKGCDLLSNLHGLIRLDYPPQQLENTFVQLERMLQREGLVRGGLVDG